MVLTYEGDDVTTPRISRRWHRRFLWAYFPPYRWWRNSRLYHRWIMWRFRRANQKLQRQIGEKLIPALQRTTQAMIEWNETFRETM